MTVTNLFFAVDLSNVTKLNFTGSAEKNGRDLFLGGLFIFFFCSDKIINGNAYSDETVVFSLDTYLNYVAVHAYEILKIEEIVVNIPIFLSLLDH